MSEKGEDIMKQKITTLLLLLCLAVALFAGCSAKNTDQEIIDGAKLSEEEREAYILEKIVGSGSILSSRTNAFAAPTHGIIMIILTHIPRPFPVKE